MSHRNRTQKLQKAARKLPSQQYQEPHEEEWLKQLEAEAKKGRFDAEPYFPAALAFFREAWLQAKKQKEIPLFPPPTYLRDLLHFPDDRLNFWRGEDRFPDLHTGLYWVMEIFGRTIDGTPPLPLTEFQELDYWFRANYDQLNNRANAREKFSIPGVDLGCGIGEPVPLGWALHDVETRLEDGGKSLGIGKAAVVIRCLRSQYGNLEGCTLEMQAASLLLYNEVEAARLKAKLE